MSESTLIHLGGIPLADRLFFEGAIESLRNPVGLGCSLGVDCRTREHLAHALKPIGAILAGDAGDEGNFSGLGHGSRVSNDWRQIRVGLGNTVAH